MPQDYRQLAIAVDMIPPAEGHCQRLQDLLAKAWRGSLRSGMRFTDKPEEEILRMKGKGVGRLQQVTVQRGKPRPYNYFDPGAGGKFACGWSGPGERLRPRGISCPTRHAGGMHQPCRYLGEARVSAFPMQHALHAPTPGDLFCLGQALCCR